MPSTVFKSGTSKLHLDDHLLALKLADDLARLAAETTNPTAVEEVVNHRLQQRKAQIWSSWNKSVAPSQKTLAELIKAFLENEDAFLAFTAPPPPCPDRPAAG